MSLEDFVSKYPYIDEADEGLDTYPDTAFEQAIYNKKEFYDLRLDAVERRPMQPGMLMNHQKIAQRYMSHLTLYDGVLFYHEVGTGKTCTAVAVCENLVRSGMSKRALVLLYSPARKQTFVKEMLTTCTSGRYAAGRTVAAACMDNKVRLWDVSSGDVIAMLEGFSSAATCVAYRPPVLNAMSEQEPLELASGSKDGTIVMWNIESMTEAARMSVHTGPVTALAWTPDGKYMISGGADARVLVISLATEQAAAELTDSNSAITAVTCSRHDNRYVIAAGSQGGEVFVWSLPIGFQHMQSVSPQRVMSATLGSAVTSIAASSDGTVVVCGTRKHGAKLLANNTMLDIGDSMASTISAVAWSHSTKRVALGDSRGNVMVGAVVQGQYEPKAVYTVKTAVSRLAFSPDGQTLTVAERRNISMFSMRDEEDRPYAVLDSPSTITDMAFSLNESGTSMSKEGKALYKFSTFQTFAKQYREQPAAVARSYDNSVIVLDEVHNMKFDGEDGDTYTYLKQFLHEVRRCKVIVLTATPMRNDPSELCKIMNLLLPADGQMQMDTPGAFRDAIMDGDRVSPEGLNTLYSFLKGRISYLRAPNDPAVVKNFVQSASFDAEEMGVGRLKLYTATMLDHQRAGYQRAWGEDRTQSDASDGSGIYTNSQQAALFVFPDGSWGPRGFSKYVELAKHKKSVRPRLKNMELSRNVDDALEELRSYSVKYAELIRILLNSRTRKAFVFCDLVKGSGLLVLAALLSHFHISFEIVTKTDVPITDTEIQNIINRYNAPENAQGATIQVLLGSGVFAESFSLKDVQQIHILTPFWNFAKVEQAVGRGVRAFSHETVRRLLGGTVTVDVYLHAAVDASAAPEESVDILKYQISEEKDVRIKRVEHACKVIAFDCQLTKKRNERPGTDDDSRECDYLPCDYECANIDDAAAGGSDLSSYFSNYDGTMLTDARARIRELFRMHNRFHLDDLWADLRNFVPSKIEMMRALREMMASRERLEDRNGFLLFLREDHNSFYLTTSLATTSTALESSYFSNPLCAGVTGLNRNIEHYVMNESIDQVIAMLEEVSISNSSDEEKRDLVSAILHEMPTNLQTMWVEAAYLAREANTQMNQTLRDIILDVYDKDLHSVQVGGRSVVLHMLGDPRCFEDGSWRACPQDVLDAFKAQSGAEVQRLVDEARARGGFYGFVDKGSFKIRDVRESQKETTGRVCGTLQKQDLIQVAVAVRLPVPADAPESGDTKEELVDAIVANKEAKAVWGAKTPEATVRDLLSKLSEEELRIVWYLLPIKRPAICAMLQARLESMQLMKK